MLVRHGQLRRLGKGYGAKLKRSLHNKKANGLRSVIASQAVSFMSQTNFALDHRRYDFTNAALQFMVVGDGASDGYVAGRDGVYAF